LNYLLFVNESKSKDGENFWHVSYLIYTTHSDRVKKGEVRLG